MTPTGHYRRIILFVAVAAFLASFVVFPILNTAGHRLATYQLQSRVDRIRVFFSTERNRLLGEARAIAKQDDVLRALTTENTIDLLSLLTDEARERKIGYVMAAASDGTVLVRTNALTRRGDRIFETTSWGRSAAAGRDLSTFGYGRTAPMVMMAGHPILLGERVTGAIFAGHVLDNAYASALRSGFLRATDQLAFYGANTGLIASSFHDAEADRLLAAYLGSGMGLAGFGGTYPEISLAGRHYVVHDIPLPGADGTAGGVLVFSEVRHAPQSAGVAFVFTILFGIALYGAARHFMTRRFLMHHWALGAGSALLFFLAVFALGQAIAKRSAFPLSPIPYVLYNSTMALDPATEMFSAHTEQRVKIVIETGGETVNAVQANIHYDPEKVNIESIITATSFCDPDLFIEKAIDASRGEVRIACGLPTPGFSGQQGIVAELVLRPLREGMFTLRFDEEAQVLANDGLGTDVLRFATNGSYQVAARGVPESGNALRVSVFSLTHPNTELVYAVRDVEFSWPRYEGYDYVYRFDMDPQRDLDGAGATMNTAAAFHADADGVYYLHIAARKDGVLGPVTTYKVSIDTAPPLPPLVRASAAEIKAGEVVRLDITTKKSADLQPVIYLRVDNGLFFPVGPQVFVPFIEPGNHMMTVRILDKAGNASEGYARVTVRGESLLDRIVNFDFTSLLR